MELTVMAGDHESYKISANDIKTSKCPQIAQVSQSDNNHQKLSIPSQKQENVEDNTILKITSLKVIVA